MKQQLIINQIDSGKVSFLLFCFSLFTFHYSFSQGVWTWMSGSENANDFAIYGTQGVPSINNHPRSLYSTYCWTDLQGNFWLYGGNDNQINFYADLWRFNPSTLEWTWVKGNSQANVAPVYGEKGVAASLNTPGSRGWSGCSWVDTNGNLWLYGDEAYSYSDLWEYNIGDNEWIWMSGSNQINEAPVYGTQGVPSSSNFPGSRGEIGSPWVDKNGNFWLYGGSVSGGYDKSDLWMYNPTLNMWTWVLGSQVYFESAVYGTKGYFSTSNTPGERNAYSMWTDDSGNMWLLGGQFGYGNLSDLWEYNPTINEWAWVSGTQSSNLPESAGVPCQTDSTFYPDPRFENRAVWKDNAGNLWTFGGLSDNGAFGDLWAFVYVKKEWARVSDGNFINAAPAYGTEGIPSFSNQPGGRYGTTHWTDKQGNFWLFGGLDYSNNALDDVWRYIPDSTCLYTKCNCTSDAITITSSKDSLCESSGLTSLLSTNSASKNLQWQSSANGNTFSDIAGATSTLYNTPSSLSKTTYYRLVACSSDTSCSSTISNVLTLHIISSSSTDFQIFPNPADQLIKVKLEGCNLQSSIQVFNCLGQLLYEGEINSEQNINTKSLSAGMYFVRLHTNNVYQTKKFIVIH